MRQRHFLIDGMKAVPINPDVPGFDWAWGGERKRQGLEDLPTVQDAYSFVSAIQRAIQLRASAVSNMPRRWMTLTGEELAGDSVPEVDKNLNDLLWRLEASLCVSGAGYAWKRPALIGNRTVALKWFASSTIKMVMNKTGQAQVGNPDDVYYFERAINSKQPIIYTQDELLHVWNPSPFVELGAGSVPLLACLPAAGVIISLDQFVNNFFSNGAMGVTLLSVDGNPSPDESKRLKTWWAQVAGGVRNAFKTEVLSRPITATKIGSDDIRQLVTKDLTEEQKISIALAFGVPHTMIYSQSANFATAEMDARSFSTGTVEPEAELIAAALNDQVFEAMGFRLEFLPDELAIHQKNESLRATSLAALVGAGTPFSLAIELLGYDFNVAQKTNVIMHELVAQFPYDDAVNMFGLTYPELQGNDIAMQVIAIMKNAVAAAPPAPSVAPLPVTPPIPTSALSIDMDKWRRKSLKRLQRGDSAACGFESANITSARKAAVMGALDAATDQAGVNAAFASPRSPADLYYSDAPERKSGQQITIHVNVPEVIVNNAVPQVDAPDVIINAQMPAAPDVTVTNIVPLVPAPNVTIQTPRVVREVQNVMRDANGLITGSITNVETEDK